MALCNRQFLLRMCSMQLAFLSQSALIFPRPFFLKHVHLIHYLSCLVFVAVLLQDHISMHHIFEVSFSIQSSKTWKSDLFLVKKGLLATVICDLISFVNLVTKRLSTWISQYSLVLGFQLWFAEVFLFMILSLILTCLQWYLFHNFFLFLCESCRVSSSYGSSTWCECLISACAIVSITLPPTLKVPISSNACLIDQNRKNWRYTSYPHKMEDIFDPRLFLPPQYWSDWRGRAQITD